MNFSGSDPGLEVVLAYHLRKAKLDLRANVVHENHAFYGIGFNMFSTVVENFWVPAEWNVYILQ